MTKVKQILIDDEVWLAVEIDENTMIEHSTIDSDAPLANWIAAPIFRKIEGKWEKIGIVNIFVEGKKIANWSDIIIGSNSQFLLFDIPDPNYNYRKYRGMGIGSKIVTYFIKYFKENGIEEIYGEISDRDDYEKVVNFWKKLGFTISPYPEKIGTSLAKIHKNIIN